MQLGSEAPLLQRRSARLLPRPCRCRARLEGTNRERFADTYGFIQGRLPALPCFPALPLVHETQIVGAMLAAAGLRGHGITPRGPSSCTTPAQVACTVDRGAAVAARQPRCTTPRAAPTRPAAAPWPVQGPAGVARPWPRPSRRAGHRRCASGSSSGSGSDTTVRRARGRRLSCLNHDCFRTETVTKTGSCSTA